MWMAGQVKDWTVSEPIKMPIVHVPQAKLEVFKDQGKLFFDLIQAGEVPGAFLVSAANMNGLAASSDYLRGNAFVTMEDNRVTVALSLPMDRFPGGKNRFLVGTESLSWDPDTSVLHAKMESAPNTAKTTKTFYDMQFQLNHMDGREEWDLMLLSGEVLGWEIPEDCIAEHKNILEGVYNCESDDEDCKRARKVIDSLKSILLEKDQVIFQGSVGDNKTEEGEGGDYRRRLLSHAEVENSNYKPRGGWKFQLVRRLA
eukprot:CAMPEP_0117005748 /NCGR_PEP_ID=MMETSP0472-20121206/6235_1 /TAXON_ID=693140 ORGANISM="Tiarina fusus, Strain LIS" /NCGR_SAMPLE_ID=MMETSP0472 /ASSEMBLY_ACC=CAM_ASM_000603 /LENGTH=256 /DNA_ID=CAMNT_0004707041 /DNA_START=248 /DNA_END=1014 /DNA_ORIENTATION=+